MNPVVQALLEINGKIVELERQRNDLMDILGLDTPMQVAQEALAEVSRPMVEEARASVALDGETQDAGLPADDRLHEPSKPRLTRIPRTEQVERVRVALVEAGGEIIGVKPLAEASGLGEGRIQATLDEMKKRKLVVTAKGDKFSPMTIKWIGPEHEGDTTNGSGQNKRSRPASIAPPVPGHEAEARVLRYLEENPRVEGWAKLGHEAGVPKGTMNALGLKLEREGKVTVTRQGGGKPVLVEYIGASAQAATN
jgi:hypothetical protein